MWLVAVHAEFDQYQHVEILMLCHYTVSQKKPPLRQVGINSVIFQIQKKRNICFVGNFILNKSCEFYYDDVTMTSFIGNK